MIDMWQTVPGLSVKRAKLLSEGKVWIETFRNDTAFRREMLELIRKDQLKERGIDEDGNVIGYYSYVTSLINPKKRFNTHYTLEDTGELYRSLFIAVTGKHFELDWNDEKIKDQDWYSESILGYTEENIDKIAKYYFDNLARIGFEVLFKNI